MPNHALPKELNIEMYNKREMETNKQEISDLCDNYDTQQPQHIMFPGIASPFCSIMAEGSFILLVQK